MRETEQAALVDILQEVATTFGDEVHTRLESSDPTGPVLPRPVAEAFAGAVAEALRNVVRHSGTRIASVRVHRGKRRIVVEVSDDGVGTGADYRPGFGIALSIRDRMREVGGDARVSPRPTGGTLVQLTWPVSSALPASAAKPSQPAQPKSISICRMCWVARPGAPT